MWMNIFQVGTAPSHASLKRTNLLPKDDDRNRPCGVWVQGPLVFVWFNDILKFRVLKPDNYADIVWLL